MSGRAPWLASGASSVGLRALMPHFAARAPIRTRALLCAANDTVLCEHHTTVYIRAARIFENVSQSVLRCVIRTRQRARAAMTCPLSRRSRACHPGSPTRAVRACHRGCVVRSRRRSGWPVPADPHKVQAAQHKNVITHARAMWKAAAAMAEPKVVDARPVCARRASGGGSPCAPGLPCVECTCSICTHCACGGGKCWTRVVLRRVLAAHAHQTWRPRPKRVCPRAWHARHAVGHGRQDRQVRGRV